MPKKKGNGGHGDENFDPATGQYISADEGGGNASSSASKTAQDASAPVKTEPEPDFSSLDFDVEKYVETLVELEPDDEPELTLDDIMAGSKENESRELEFEDLMTSDGDDGMADVSDDDIDAAMSMSPEKYDLVYNQGRKVRFYDNFDFQAVEDEIENFLDDETISYLKNTNWSYSGNDVYIPNVGGGNSNLKMNFAMHVLSKGRYAKSKFKPIGDKEFTEIKQTLPQYGVTIDSKTGKKILSYSISQKEVMDQIRNQPYIQIYRGMDNLSNQDIDLVLSHYKDVKGRPDSLLADGGGGTMNGRFIYCSLRPDYSLSYAGSYQGKNGTQTNHKSFMMQLLVVNDGNTKIAMPNDKRTAMSMYQRHEAQIQSKIMAKLTQEGVLPMTARRFVASMGPISRANDTLPLLLLGYDGYYDGDDQLDMLNPSRVLMNKDSYRPTNFKVRQ